MANRNHDRNFAPGAADPVPPAIVALLVPSQIPFVGIAGLQQTGAVAPGEQKGSIVFDPSALYPGNALITRSVVFDAVLECALGGGVQTCSLELFNITDSVTVATLSTQNNFPTLVSMALTIGNGAGQLPPIQKLYKLILSQAGGLVTDLVSCTLAGLLVNYT